MTEEVKINEEAVVAETETTEPVRTPRGSEDREVTQRVESWENPSNLPNPDPQPGWVFRWIRTSMVGKSDNTNVSMRFREGWEAVRAEDHPELNVISDHESRFPGCVEVGGLLLCKAPEESCKTKTSSL